MIAPKLRACQANDQSHFVSIQSLFALGNRGPVQIHLPMVKHMKSTPGSVALIKHSAAKLYFTCMLNIVRVELWRKMLCGM